MFLVKLMMSTDLKFFNFGQLHIYIDTNNNINVHSRIKFSKKDRFIAHDFSFHSVFTLTKPSFQLYGDLMVISEALDRQTLDMTYPRQTDIKQDKLLK